MDAHRVTFRLVRVFRTFCQLGVVVAPDRHVPRVYLASIGTVYVVNTHGGLIGSYRTQHSWSYHLAAACDGVLCVASTHGSCGVYTPTGTFHSIASVTPHILDVNVARGGVVYVVGADQPASTMHIVVLQLRCHDHGVCLEQKWRFERPPRSFLKVCLTAHDEPLLLDWVKGGYAVSPLHDPGHVIGHLGHSGPFSAHPNVTGCQSLLVTNPGESLRVHRLDGRVVAQHWPKFSTVAWVLCASDRYVFVAVWSTVYVFALS